MVETETFMKSQKKNPPSNPQDQYANSEEIRHTKIQVAVNCFHLHGASSQNL